ncbi:helix-turn-helix domain-containing protein, partial [Kitasatospora arboriphila]|uniref:helix-turn-helix domain-containing protein n=1 Tax=Kitasatospora arboriphila TaxID=258052 RepID=UPI0031DCA5F0
MSVQQRKERERADRERLIVATARELAEQQGWDAVTTRRLAERIEYSQPVLYSHFRGKREIIGAVALDGAAEMAVAVRAAAGAGEGPRARGAGP